MTIEDIKSKYDKKDILEAAHQIETEEKIRMILKDSRWKDTPIILKNSTFLLPLLDYERRPLAVTLHSYGLWIEPIYVAYQGGHPDKDFALHIDEEDDGLWLHIEDALSMTISGSYELGFKLEIKEKDEKTQIIDTTPKYR
jgi:8-oxo-dGTP pyrophosphatase MutT (NUDIX family)